MRTLVLLFGLLSLSVFGQGSVRYATSLTNLLSTVDPANVATGGRVAYLVPAYVEGASWGGDREIVATKLSGTTNEGCTWLSPVNTNWYWRASDCSGNALDPRWFGAIVDDQLDDFAAVQATINAAGARASVHLPNGRFLLSSPLSYKDRLHVKGEGAGSMLAVTTTNGIAFWNGTPGTRIYEVCLENFAINTALGARGYAAVTLTNVSYARLEKLVIHAYDGLGFRIGVKPWGDSPSSVGGAWSSSMVGCSIYVYPRPGEPAYAFYGDGGPDWGHGPNSWRIIDNYLNCQLVIAGGITNYGTAVVYAKNQNGIQLSLNIFEGYYTNSVFLEKGAASSIMGNRFEVSYGIGGADFAAIKLVNMTNVFIGGNMSQGLGDLTKYVRGSNSSYTLFDAASQSPNTIDGDLLIGRTWSVDDTGYLPYVTNYAIVASKRNPEKLGMGLRTIDGTVNPRTIMTLNAEPGATDSWAGIFHGSSLATVPFYFYASRTNLAITESGIGVLGMPVVSAALSAYGNGAFGSAPSVSGGWTDMAEGVWVRTTDLSKKTGFHAIINDGVTNRRIEMTVSLTNSAIRTTATTAGLPLDFWVSGQNPLSLDTTGVRVKTNLFMSTGAAIIIGGDTVSDFTGSGLSIVGGALTVSGLGGMAYINDAPNDGQEYVRKNLAWAVSSGGGGGGATNGSRVHVDGVFEASPNLDDSPEIDPDLSGTNILFNIVANSIETNKLSIAAYLALINRANHYGTIGWSYITGTPTSLAGYGITDAQLTNSTLTRFAGIGPGVSGDILYRDATGWTNLAKSTDGKVLKLTSGFPSWQDDDTSGSGGSSTNVLVNTNLVTQANFINSPTAMLAVDGSKIQVHVTNNLPAGWYANGFLPLFAGVSNMLTGDLFRRQNSDIREPMWEDGTQWNAVGLRANSGKLSMAEFNTNDWTVLEEFIVVDPTDPTDDVITFGNSGFNNKVVFEADVDFQGTVTGLDAAAFESGTLNTNRLDTNTVQLAVAGATGDGTFMRTRTGVIREIWVPANAMTPGSDTPTASTNSWATTTDGQKVETWDFSFTSTNSVYWTMTLPSAWNGSTVKAKLFWKQVVAEATSTNSWQIGGGSLNDTETGGNTLGTLVEVLDVGANDTNVLSITPASGAITIGGTPSAGHLTWFTVRRHPGDTDDQSGVLARLFGALVQFTETATEPSAW